ncbi:PREDICTED: usherin [Nanorana parkeri]|uniref:usherin n=1 Tax=Nanorana parkeri TaxID=125878 RepID=UPI00085406A0|nr:PREDICTED: usherin [Nanorana parkeri]
MVAATEIFEVFHLGFHTHFALVRAQGLFPKLENLAAFKPISTEPPNATCGFPQRSVFCQSALDQQSLQTCIQRFCVQDCPYRSYTPGYHHLLEGDLGHCIRKDAKDLHPKSSKDSYSLLFYDHKDCFIITTMAKVGISLTLTAWLKPEQAGEMCVIEKSADGQIVFKLTISERETVFYYRTVNGLQPPIKVMTQGRFSVKRWIHLSVQVHYTRISFFIDGPEEDFTAFDSRILTDPVYDNAENSDIRLGQNMKGMEQFIGRIQDFRLYSVALTNREISNIYSGKFPLMAIQPECRCPSSHPRLEPMSGRYCLPNGVDDSSKDKVLRLNPDAHPVPYMNDNDLNTTWISSLLSSSDIDKGITIIVDLDNGQYQVFYITLWFYSPLPKALRIQRKNHRSSAWEDWQYLASDCGDFTMENNGFLQYSDSVNCLQIPKDTPYSRGNLTLSLLTPEPNHRPGYNDFHSTTELQEFVKASLVRIQLIGQYYTTESTGSIRHRYYGIGEITISGRCNCHGHANGCDMSVSPYKCLCDVNSYTDGNNCDRCLPLYNDKPFRQGDHVNAFNCRPCQCYNHSSSCHYDATVDLYPHDHESGGGGVCDNCLHNTTGRNCEVCKDDFFRQFDADPAATDVCQPCDCNRKGTVNKSHDCEKAGGQCICKVNIWGRQCDQCKDGFYNLQESNADGCQPCRCNTTGTLNGSNTCHHTTGQCRCKPNIIGPLCDRCKLGYKQDVLGRESCTQCMCDAYGSINQFCNPTSGQCKCRENASGLRCDTCIDNYYRLSAGGCKPCECHTEGIIPGTVCDALTGQCVCQLNAGGRQCNECLHGYYKSTQNGSMSCLPCQCDGSGAINGSQACDKLTGQCLCKASVTGSRCSVCISHTFNLTAVNLLGCQDCDCDPFGSLPVSVCDPIDGQCQCMPDFQGRRCSRCKPGLYSSGDWGTGCVPCLCHPRGSVNAICNYISGQCKCGDSSVSGVKCDQCSDYFYGFYEDTGRCQPCSCNTAGAVNGSCHSISGQCFCKQFVRGITCDECIEGASNMDVNNPYGCSATPSQQPPPRGQILNSTTIILTWNPPDSPNGDHIHYVLYRDDLGIYHTADYYPYSPQSYTDEHLLPYTTYTYYVDARNVRGAIHSTKVVFRTRAGAPSGSSEVTVAYQGLDTKVTIHNLTPFTRYNFSVQACNSEGCLQSSLLTLVTAQAPPVGQTPPVVNNAGSTELYLQWSPPLQPNGVIIRHELYMRSIHQTVERRVFHASGWLNPQPLLESENENALQPPVTNAIISNLEPNTEYEFCLVTTNMAGSVGSKWVTLKTEESEPIFMAPPIVFPLSSHSLNVSWERPSNDVTRGEVTGYIINLSGNLVDAIDIGRGSSEVIYVAESNEFFYEVSGLEPYVKYVFTITLCNKVGCVTSDPGFGKTLAAAPEKLHTPLVEGINSTSMRIAWSAPVKLNGPSPFYQLERIEPSLTIDSNMDYVKGTHFPGHGYYKFPASTLPANTYFTGIKIQFRTKESDGLLVCAVSAGTQEEYIVLQIRRGRLYFLFDPQTSAQFELKYTHSIAMDHGIPSFASSSGAGTVIGDNTGVYIGGLPKHFSVERDDTGDTEIVRKSFVGCLGDIYIQRRDISTEEWDLLDWVMAEERHNVYEKWEGCPETSDVGAHFLGFGFLELYPDVFPGGPNVEISFMFKTDQLRGLLLFMSGKDGLDYILAELNNGIVTLQCKTKMSLTRVNLWVGLSYCDGRWNTVYLKREGSVFSVQLNALVERVIDSAASQIEAISAVYVGGVPETVWSSFPELHTQQGFGGCMKDIRFTQGAVVNIASVSSTAVRVDLDGCPSTDSSVNCRGNDSIIVYRGGEETAHDHSLQPFKEYLYRVIASNEGGSRASDWIRGRSKAAFPVNGQTPIRVLGVSGHGIEVTWDRPAGIRGVTERYILEAIPENNSNTSTVSALFHDTSHVSGTLTGLLPFTKYAVTLSACTLAGCSVISHVVNVTTREEAPEDVEAPIAMSSPSSLLVHWLPPKHPNGEIKKYVLYMDGAQIYIGDKTEYNVTGLGTFAAHRFAVAACTLVGCTNSSEVTLLTAQLPPQHVPLPGVTVVDSTSIYVKWKEPGIINGVLERYLLYMTIDVTNSSAWDPVYNSTELFQDYTIQGLIPGITYFIRLSACSGGGCTSSGITEASTEESVPDGIQSVTIQSLSPDSFNITWSEPRHPNGVITSYGLYMDGILMQNSSRLSYFVDGLTPWSKHSFRLRACTAKGCALGEKVEAHTQETKPEGTILLYSTINSPRSALVTWEGPEKPNGHMTYDIHFSGLFYEIEGSYNLLNFPRILHQSKENIKWVAIDNLVPFSSYTAFVNASNSQGHVTSDPVIITMPPGAPDGVLPPRLSSANPTSLQVVWPTPVRNNAPGLPSYRLQMRSTNPTNKITDLFSGPSASLTYTIKDLQPYTAYELRIVAFNVYGETYSRWVNMSTEQDKPGPMNPPILFSLESRTVTVTWPKPSQPNGIITHFNIYQDGSLQAVVPGNSSRHIFQNVIPYTTYHFQLEACTSAGCSLSQESLGVMTPPDAPSGISPLDLHSDTPTSVMIRWRPPLHPNGLVENIRIERRLKGTDHVYTLVTLNGHHPMLYLDQTNGINPWETYEYRIGMTTFNGGSNSSEWAEVTTRPARPVGVQPPEVTVFGPYTAKITWKVPLLPNGEILSYEIRMPEPKVVITDTALLSYTMTNLIPYTNYSVTVVACSGGGSYLGGCTESQPTLVTTQPAPPEGVGPLSVLPVSETFIAVSWQPPSRPNGPDVRFELLRRTILQPLASNPPKDLNLWQNIYSGTRWFYEDKGLSRYTSYEYRLIVHNVVGYAFSSDVIGMTLPGPPIRGNHFTAHAINHTAIEASWTKPTVQDLQGDVDHYSLILTSSRYNKTLTFPADVKSTVIGGLYPHTKNQLYLEVSNGPHSISSGWVHVTTPDGVPEGMLPPEVVAINGTAVRIIWTPPLNPNGVVTEYSIYVNDKGYRTERNTPHPFIVDDLAPYIVYNIQVEVCTLYACMKSDATQVATIEKKPSQIPSPDIKLISSRGSVGSLEFRESSLRCDDAGAILLAARPRASCSVVWLNLPPRLLVQDMVVSVGRWAHDTRDERARIAQSCTMQAAIAALPHGFQWGNIHAEIAEKRYKYLFLRYTMHSWFKAVTVTMFGSMGGIAAGNRTLQLADLFLNKPHVFTKIDYHMIRNRTDLFLIVNTIAGSIALESVEISWAPPENPNGIILGYELRRRTLYPYTVGCSLTMDGNGQSCKAMKCKKGEEICGGACYKPHLQVCCSGVLHSRRDGYHCCEGNYIAFAGNSSWICCAAQVHAVQPGHQCCGRYYVKVQKGEVCCYDGIHNEVSMGEGDSCCGEYPYLSGYQMCCGEVLYDGYNQQCCGGKTVPQNSICCGDEKSGAIYRQSRGLSCCGTDYVNMSETICCAASNGQFKAHLKSNNGTPLKCCEMELITEGEECCSGIGYNPLTHVCSGKPSTEDFTKSGFLSPDPGNGVYRLDELVFDKGEMCPMNTLCPASLASTAHCGECSFNSSTHSCFWVEGSKFNKDSLLDGNSVCRTDEDIIYTGEARTYLFVDTSLQPFSTYEYRVLSWNSFGQGFSNASQVTTNQDIPRGIRPPKWTLVVKREDLISLMWEEPTELNGIVHYVLLRDGRERYRGTGHSFQDRGGIHPFVEYMYQIRACTIAGCLDSAKAIAATKQGVPENGLPPIVTTVNSTALHVSWAEPRKPNGEIREYQLHQVGRGLIHVSVSGRKQYTVTGLEPYTKYFFFLVICTSFGCSNSEVSAGHTSQAAPQGVWLNPYHITINSSALELYWREPERPNGMVSQYRLIRDGTVISTRSGEYLNFTDSGLKPNSRFTYQLEARTEAGGSISDIYVVDTPMHTPEQIPIPHNITVLRPQSILVTWDLPGVYNSSIPLEFNILLSTGGAAGQHNPAGEKHFLILEDLIPGMSLSIRLQACQNGSCGVSQPALVATMEAEPEGLNPPMLVSDGEKAVKISWTMPMKPNGIIIGYTIHRRLTSHPENITLLTWLGGDLEYTDISDELQPYTTYEYCITAQNSVGSVESPWSSIRTMEAAPEDIQPPTAKATGAYSFFLSWAAPSTPHGIIKKYVIIYGLGTSDPAFINFTKAWLTVPGTTNEAKVFGLFPFTTYHICIEAANSAGSVSSGWISVQTWEAAPSGLSNFTVDNRESGRALLLQWSAPERTNGILLMYNIYSDDNLEYSGLARQFLFRRLEPYTVYNLVLEACTSAGYTQTFPQRIQTDEASPSSQLPPHVQSLNATHITLSWFSPSQPNGQMTRYEVIKRCTQENSPGNKKRTNENFVFRETNTEQKVFTFTDVGLHPWTHYEYKIRGWNSVGYTDSPWMVAQTSQAAPGHLIPPKVFHSDIPNQIIIQWTKPRDENGNVLYFRLQKNNVILPYSFDSATFNYTDEDVLPYTEYTYSIIACTIAGCTTSDLTPIKTVEGPPSFLKLPIVEPLSSTEVNVFWDPPSMPNGEITKYIIQIDKDTYFAGKRLSMNVSSLLPFTLYNISLVACTSGGCTTSSRTHFRTMEAQPSHIKPPIFTVTSAQSIKISWQGPDKPNGEIRNYEVRRNGQLIYAGLDTHYHDFGLQPGTEYTYVIQATNSKGSCLSSPARIRTHPSSPSGMEPPQLQAVSAHEILATWQAPLKTNGEILNYALYVHHPAEMKVSQYHFNGSYVSRTDHSFVIKDLNPYTHHAPSLAWNGPLYSNGKILTYEVYRRTLNEEVTPPELAYNGSFLSFQDVTLLPFTEYEYKVWAVNSAGRTSSPWTRCRTSPAAPEGLTTPIFHAVSATSAVANITPPTKANGIVTLYRLFSRNDKGMDIMLSEGTSNVQVIYGLKPFSNYSVGIEACTCLPCCSKGPVAQLTTHPAPPSHQGPPLITLKASRAVSLRWSQPRSPNGIIQQYEVHLQTICPPTIGMVEKMCSQGPVEVVYSGMEEACNVTHLQPFTTYSFRVACYNSEGSATSEWINCTTLKEKPEYKAVFYVLSNITAIFVDWRLSFHLHGQLKEFVLTERGERLYSGLDTSVHIPKISDKTFYFQVRCTTDMGSVSTPIVKYNSATGLAPAHSIPSTKNGTEVRGKAVYTELWFIILMALLGLLLLAVFLSLVLQMKLTKHPFPRERPPLVPLQQRMSPSKYSENETYTKRSDSQQPALPSSVIQACNPVGPAENVLEKGISDIKISGMEAHTSRNTMVVRKTSQGQISHSFSQNSLHRSASQLISSQDKKSILEGSIWDSVIQGHDSGMYVDDEDLISTIKSFSTVAKQQTAFTDTPL